jgi:hypothetical protein
MTADTRAISLLRDRADNVLEQARNAEARATRDWNDYKRSSSLARECWGEHATLIKAICDLERAVDG